ncbi:hypothetical protein HNQ37_000588 [Lactovum miscens]|uniref:Uncharacterized protein n=1 Tax=Lactovum miscens TaxID=190387 RepID=A0A841C5U2_9LACT|nr:hypothetical protein [Lactovum miscens]
MLLVNTIPFPAVDQPSLIVYELFAGSGAAAGAGSGATVTAGETVAATGSELGIVVELGAGAEEVEDSDDEVLELASELELLEECLILELELELDTCELLADELFFPLMVLAYPENPIMESKTSGIMAISHSLLLVFL